MGCGDLVVGLSLDHGDIAGNGVAWIWRHFHVRFSFLCFPIVARNPLLRRCVEGSVVETEVRGYKPPGGDDMLWTIFVILLVLWLLGMITSYTLGGFIHLLLVIALVVLLVQLITGRRHVL